MIQRKGVHTLSCRDASLTMDRCFLSCFMKSVSMLTCRDFRITVMQGQLRWSFFFMSQSREGSSTVDWAAKMKSLPHQFILTQHCNTFDLRLILFFKPSTPLPCSHISNWVIVWIFMTLHDNFPLFHVKTYVNSESCSFKTTLYPFTCLPLLPQWITKDFLEIKANVSLHQAHLVLVHTETSWRAYTICICIQYTCIYMFCPLISYVCLSQQTYILKTTCNISHLFIFTSSWR